LLAGGEQWILLHLEVQSSREADFTVRIARYNSGLFWTFEQRVVTLVVLADLDQDWRPSEDVFRVADFESRLQFPVCKLIDKLRRNGGTIIRCPSKSPGRRSRPCARLATRKAGIEPSGGWYAICTLWVIMRRKCGRSSA